MTLLLLLALPVNGGNPGGGLGPPEIALDNELLTPGSDKRLSNLPKMFDNEFETSVLPPLPLLTMFPFTLPVLIPFAATGPGVGPNKFKPGNGGSWNVWKWDW